MLIGFHFLFHFNDEKLKETYRLIVLLLGFLNQRAAVVRF